MDNLYQIKASDCKCIVCGKQAEVFWPNIDPDIPSHPYCQECVEKAKDEIICKIYGLGRNN